MRIHQCCKLHKRNVSKYKKKQKSQQQQERKRKWTDNTIRVEQKVFFLLMLPHKTYWISSFILKHRQNYRQHINLSSKLKSSNGWKASLTVWQVNTVEVRYLSFFLPLLHTGLTFHVSPITHRLTLYSYSKYILFCHCHDHFVWKNNVKPSDCISIKAHGRHVCVCVCYRPCKF